MEEQLANVERSFKEMTWEDVYTSSQKQQMIAQVSGLLEDIVKSVQAEGLLEPIKVGEMKREIAQRSNSKYDILFISKDGLVEGQWGGASMNGQCKIVPDYLFMPSPVQQEAYSKIIESYQLDYKKLEPIINKIKSKIV